MLPLLVPALPLHWKFTAAQLVESNCASSSAAEACSQCTHLNHSLCQLLLALWTVSCNRSKCVAVQANGSLKTHSSAVPAVTAVLAEALAPQLFLLQLWGAVAGQDNIIKSATFQNTLAKCLTSSESWRPSFLMDQLCLLHTSVLNCPHF